MNFSLRDIQLAKTIVAVALACSGAGHAQQNYPARPVRVIVTVQPGGAADFIARILAQKLGDIFGQPWVVENRSGRGAVLGADPVAKAAPDGHTALLASITTHGIGPHMYSRLNRLNAESNRVLATQDVKDRMAAVGIDAAGGTPEDFDHFIRDEIAKWGPVVKAAGIHPQ